jgi:calcineurin-like phosphoesterase family protein
MSRVRQPRTWFTGDSHFGHGAIIDMACRPYRDVDEMDRAMIRAWNDVVASDDIVWHLGDFAHKAEPARVKSIFSALHGKKSLILGNHDKQATLQCDWEEAVPMRGLAIDGQQIVMCHYGMRVWPGMHRGMFYGHSHGRLPGSRQTLDVGVDSVGFAPVDLPTILARMAALPRLAYDEGRPIGEDLEDALTL